VNILLQRANSRTLEKRHEIRSLIIIVVTILVGTKYFMVMPIDVVVGHDDLVFGQVVPSFGKDDVLTAELKWYSASDYIPIFANQHVLNLMFTT
jgi:hypothetical protein